MSHSDPIVFSPERIYAEFLTRGSEWADAEAAASLLDEGKKPMLAKLKIAAPAKSDAAKEMEALSHPDYSEYIREMVNARHKANKARVAYDAVKVLAEMRRSEHATRRAEMTFVQGGSAG